jgi:predicted 2-oxoglutarate/Fe(II)-dependent dioxygenase YbiX
MKVKDAAIETKCDSVNIGDSSRVENAPAGEGKDFSDAIINHDNGPSAPIKEEAVDAVKANASFKEEKKEDEQASEGKDESNEKTVKEENKNDLQEDDEEKEEGPTTLQDVYESLDDLQTPGSTCTGGVASVLPILAGLTVQRVGIVPLPITETTAKALKAVAQHAPHGKGTETIVDRTVRDTLQINADQVSFQNPQWKESLEKLVHAAATALRVAPNTVEAHLYKLLLYETGGFFKKHRDTEKENGMFATLVVQLPSVFEGGSFVVSHNGKSQAFKLDAITAPYACHYVAHYADCEHEILPVTSGYRLALVYSLCYKGKSTEAPSARALETSGRMVKSMERLPRDKSLFAIPLDHQYTTKSLASSGVGALKGEDRALAITIARVKDWKMIIAQVERTDHEYGSDGWGGHSYADETERDSPYFQSLYNANGSNAQIHRDWIRNQLQFSSVEEDGMILACRDSVEEMWQEDSATEVEYTGNKGASREVTYTTCMLVAYSKSGVLERIFRSNIHTGVTQVLDKPQLLPRLLQFMQRNKPIITYTEFGKLYPLLAASDSIMWQTLIL